MGDAKNRQLLLSRLDAAAPLDDPTAFVLLWTYFEEVGLSDVERGFVLQNFVPAKVEAYPLRTNDPSYTPERGRQWLAKKRLAFDFDQGAAAWLKGLDRLLAMERGTFESRAIEGFDGRTYRVRPVNNAIAEFFSRADRTTSDSPEVSAQRSKRGVTSSASQSLSLAAYCRRFRVIPSYPIRGVSIETPTWGDPSITHRLHARVKNGLRFLAWPLRSTLKLEKRPADNGSFVRVTVVESPAKRRSELRQAVADARKESAAILILPELSVAGEDVAALQEALAENDYDDCPLLTIAGIEHRHDGEADINEAIVFGPDGTVLHTHRKITRYGDEDAIEGTTTGDCVTVLESPLGNLAPLICLDLFNDTVEEVVAASHANVLLVPSLSRKTTAHQTAAFEFLASNAATTVVCNRWLDRPDSGRRHSFAVLPGKKADGTGTLLIRLNEDEEYLLALVE